jgi:hypothetical protein
VTLSSLLYCESIGARHVELDAAADSTLSAPSLRSASDFVEPFSQVLKIKSKTEKTPRKQSSKIEMPSLISPLAFNKRKGRSFD